MPGPCWDAFKCSQIRRKQRTLLINAAAGQFRRGIGIFRLDHSAQRGMGIHGKSESSERDAACADRFAGAAVERREPWDAVEQGPRVGELGTQIPVRLASSRASESEADFRAFPNSLAKKSSAEDVVPPASGVSDALGRS